MAAGTPKLSPNWQAQCQQAGFRIERLNTLSAPKGTKYVCELTGAPASVQLVTPYVTLNYATAESAELSWASIIHKICPLLGPLRTPPPIIGSAEERARRQYTLQMSKRALIDLCKNEASKYLVGARHELAIPSAIESLKFAKEVYGESSIELVPSYLLLAEATLGLGRYQQAEEFLSMANWSVLKNPKCGNAIRSQLHRNFGKLYAHQNKHDEALEQLANDVYFASLEVGPEHVDTAGGYYHMANVFYAQNRIENALAFYDKVVDIWYKFLASVRNSGAGGGPDPSTLVGEAQLEEAVEMLRRILSTREKFLGDIHIATGEARYTLGLLQLFRGDSALALEFITKAATIYHEHLGPDHPSTRDVQEMLAHLNDQMALAGAAGAGDA